MLKDDIRYMSEALDLARRGIGYTSPNPMVGAVVVKDNRIVGRGYHAFAGGPHAEVNAIDDAGKAAKDAAIYVTLEPCNHTGRTPPCTEKIISSGIRKVVYAMDDPNPSVRGGGGAYLESKGIVVQSGVCALEAMRLNECFIKHITTGEPFVIVKCASTLDGRIATRTGDSKWISNELSRAFVHEVRHAVDGIMIGAETLRKDDPSLTTRLPDKKGSDPVRIILDTHLSISENARVLSQESSAKTLVIAGDRFPDHKAQMIVRAGGEVISCPTIEGKLDLSALMPILGARGMNSILIEGGAGVIGSAFRSGIVDKVFLFFAPKILGGDDGVPICRGAGPEFMKDALGIEYLQVKRFGEDILVEGYMKDRAVWEHAEKRPGNGD